MSYLSPLLTAIVNAVKKSASSLDRDFSELEQLQNSVRGNKNFVFNSYSRLEKGLKAELGKIRPDIPVFTPNDSISGVNTGISGRISRYSHRMIQFPVSPILLSVLLKV